MSHCKNAPLQVKNLFTYVKVCTFNQKEMYPPESFKLSLLK